MISDGKGPVSDLSVESDVADATVAYLNEHRSGIAGRPVELVKCEALADPAIGTDCANRMVEEDVVAVVVGSSSVVESIWEPLHAAGVPVMFHSASGAPLGDSESTFALTDSSFSLIDFPIQVAKDEGAEKVTAVTIDVPAAIGIYQTAAPPLFEEAGIELEVVPIPPGTADMTPQMQALVAGDPGIVQVVGNDAFCISRVQRPARSRVHGYRHGRLAVHQRPRPVKRSRETSWRECWSRRPCRLAWTTRRPACSTPLRPPTARTSTPAESPR